MTLLYKPRFDRPSDSVPVAPKPSVAPLASHPRSPRPFLLHPWCRFGRLSTIRGVLRRVDSCLLLSPVRSSVCFLSLVVEPKGVRSDVSFQNLCCVCSPSMSGRAPIYPSWGRCYGSLVHFTRRRLTSTRFTFCVWLRFLPGRFLHFME